MEFVLQHGFIAQGLAPFYAWITPELFPGWLHLLFWRLGMMTPWQVDDDIMVDILWFSPQEKGGYRKHSEGPS